MTSAEQVTRFALMRVSFQTPFGDFPTQEEAIARCHGYDLDPSMNAMRQEEPITVRELIDALNEYCGALAEEYDFCVSPSIRYDSPEKENSRLPARYRWLVAYAVEGNSEGYYVHVGAIIQPTLEEARNGSQQTIYLDLGFCKTYSPDSAYTIAREAQRFLTAAMWN